VLALPRILIDYEDDYDYAYSNVQQENNNNSIYFKEYCNAAYSFFQLSHNIIVINTKIIIRQYNRVQQKIY